MKTGWLVVIAALGIAASVSPPALAEKGPSTGTFIDRSDNEYRWEITDGHGLRWAGKPYVPRGVILRSQFLQVPTDANFEADVRLLDQWRAAGVKDLWIDPVRGLTMTPVADTQRLIDAVEGRGFRYGLAVRDVQQQPLVGIATDHESIEVPAKRLQPESFLTWRVAAPAGRRVFYSLIDTQQLYEIASGDALVENGEARIRIRLPRSRLLGRTPGRLFIMPERQLAPEDQGSFGDMWGGMEAHQRRLVAYFKQLEFGSGLRFILDPFRAGDGSVGGEGQLFPTSERFQSSFRAWLTRQRVGIIGIRSRWGFTDKTVPSMEVAARLIPMWPKGDPPRENGWLWDPEERTAYRVAPHRCRIWSDLETFRSDSLHRALNDVAEALKRSGTDVPVLYTWTGYHPVFSNSPSPNGYDGLAAVLGGKVEDLARTQGGYVLAQIEEADRRSWLLAAELHGGVDAHGAPLGLSGPTELRQAWAALKKSGCRGFFIDPARSMGLESVLASGMDGAADDAKLVEQRTAHLFFPVALASADRVRQFENEAWWLPSRSGAMLLRYGRDVRAYEIERPFGDEHPLARGTVLWTEGEPRKLTFFTDPLQPVTGFRSDGTLLKLKGNKKKAIINISAEPVVIGGLRSQRVFPLELVMEALEELHFLIRLGERRDYNVGAAQAAYTNSLRIIRDPGTAIAVYAIVAPYVRRLNLALSPYLWIEGERPVYHNFNGRSFLPGSSEGMFLRLKRGRPNRSGPFTARYRIAIQEESGYEVWIAGRVPGADGASPMTWQVDDLDSFPVTPQRAPGEEYASGFKWYRIGRVTLERGFHTLTFRVGDPGGGGQYEAAIDAIVLARQPFQPDGVEQPRLFGDYRNEQRAAKKTGGKKGRRKRGKKQERVGTRTSR